jgi:S1-C subfamily serine protease
MRFNMPRRNEALLGSLEILRKSLSAVAWIQMYGNDNRVYSASGVCVDKSGVILTADHLFQGVDQVKGMVVYINGRQIIKPLRIERSTLLDFALIRFSNVSGLPEVKMSETDLPTKEVSPVVIVGNQLVGNNGYQQILMKGVAVTPRSIYQTDARYPNMTPDQLYDFAFGSTDDNNRMILPGYSGGPLFNPEGLVVGIVKGKSYGVNNLFSDYRFTVNGVAIRSTALLKEINS